MTYSSLQFLIEVTFNLTLVDESACTSGGRWKNDVPQLILSACNWCPMMLSKLSLQPFSPSEVLETSDLSTPKRVSSIVRGRDLPFPTKPLTRRSSLQILPMRKNSVLVERRYSVQPAEQEVPSRGRSVRRTRPSRPTLSRSDSRTLSPETSPGSEELSPPHHQTSRNNTLLRVPPFPLPHRISQRPASEPLGRLSMSRKAPRPISKRMTSIPPPLMLAGYISFRLEDEDEDSPVLGREEMRHLLLQRSLVV